MIPARVDPPPAAPVRNGPQRPGAKDRDAPAFDDAMRKQEAAQAEPDKDDPVPDANTAPPAADSANGAAPAPVAPVALDALIAQVLPPSPASSEEKAPEPAPADVAVEVRGGLSTGLDLSRDIRRASSSNARSGDGVATGDETETDVDVSIDAPDSAAPKRLPAVAQDAPGQQFRAQRDRGDSQDASRNGASAFTPANGADPHGDAVRARRAESADGAAPVRDVGVRKVTTATHFPVTADPVRQIATEVARALEAPSAPATADPAAPQPVKTVSVQLEPEALGTVTLRMRLSGNQLSIRVDVAEPATLEMIQRDRDRLQKSMASGSVSVDRLEILAAREPPPVQGGDNANAPKQDTNAAGQQSRQNATSQGGDQRGGHRSQPQPQTVRSHGNENDSSRGSDSRSLYL